jgi:hypothetical protein
MSHLVRAILTFYNPTKIEMLHLNNLIYKGISLTEQSIYVASPPTNLLHYSCTRLENIKLAHALSLNEISPEFINEFNKDFKQFKILLEKHNNSKKN